MSPIDPGLGGGSDGYGSERDDDRNQLYAEREYRDRRGYGDHGVRASEFADAGPRLLSDNQVRRRRASVSPFVLAGVALIVIAIGAGFYFLRGNTVTIDIVEGDEAPTVAAKLAEANDQIDPTEAQALIEGPGPGIIPGVYELDDQLGTIDQVRALQADWVDADPGITFPEGFTVQKIAARIAANRWQYTTDGLITASQGLTVDPRLQRPDGNSSTEGLLFPSTYSIGSELEASRTMGVMLVTMQDLVFEEFNIEQVAQELGRTPYELMIIASLIEKEAKTDGDRSLISRVIHNRIDRNMMLQIDASLYYQAPEDASFSELREADSPYNLYKVEGLPPTPIANPGRASIEAALNPAPPIEPSDKRCAEVAPEDCALLFYVLSDSDGNHAFSVTNAQHEANIAAAKEAGVL